MDIAQEIQKEQLRDDVPGVMVSNGHLLVPQDVGMLESRVKATLSHEVGTHIVTYYNGCDQPFRQLYVGMANYEPLQEGLAVLGEYLVGGLSHQRLRLLAGRVVGDFDRRGPDVTEQPREPGESMADVARILDEHDRGEHREQLPEPRGAGRPVPLQSAGEESAHDRKSCEHSPLQELNRASLTKQVVIEQRYLEPGVGDHPVPKARDVGEIDGVDRDQSEHDAQQRESHDDPRRRDPAAEAAESRLRGLHHADGWYGTAVASEVPASGWT
jgi:hypothetical protein